MQILGIFTVGTLRIVPTNKMSTVEDKFKELQDLFNKWYDQLGSTLSNVQAASKEFTCQG